jgi:hypothetical protein
MIPKELSDKPMSRKDFLKVAGLGILTIFGVSNYLQFFMKHHPAANKTVINHSATNGFGSRPFGS